MDKQQLNAEMLKDIPGFMDRLFGKGAWIYDEAESYYIARDPKYQGDEFGFVAVSKDGTWFSGVRPVGAVIESILKEAMAKLTSLGLHSVASPLSMPQGMSFGLHVGETLQAAIAGELATTLGAEAAHSSKTSQKFAEDVAEALAQAAINRAASKSQ